MRDLKSEDLDNMLFFKYICPNKNDIEWDISFGSLRFVEDLNPRLCNFKLAQESTTYLDLINEKSIGDLKDRQNFLKIKAAYRLKHKETADIKSLLNSILCRLHSIH